MIEYFKKGENAGSMEHKPSISDMIKGEMLYTSGILFFHFFANLTHCARNHQRKNSPTENPLGTCRCRWTRCWMCTTRSSRRSSAPVTWGGSSRPDTRDCKQPAARRQSCGNNFHRCCRYTCLFLKVV